MKTFMRVACMVVAVSLGAGCVRHVSDARSVTPPPPVVLSQEDVLGGQPPPREERPGIHFQGGKAPFILIVLTRNNPDAACEESTPMGPVSYLLESRQDGERDANDNLVTPGMGFTRSLRLDTPRGVPVLVRMELAPIDPTHSGAPRLGGTLVRRKTGIFEDVWVQGGSQEFQWRTSP